jgi:hypothetical protein
VRLLRPHNLSARTSGKKTRKQEKKISKQAMMSLLRKTLQLRQRKIAVRSFALRRIVIRVAFEAA